MLVIFIDYFHFSYIYIIADNSYHMTEIVCIPMSNLYSSIPGFLQAWFGADANNSRGDNYEMRGNSVVQTLPHPNPPILFVYLIPQETQL